MLATPGDLPDGPEWLFEVKWDGMRLLAEVVDGAVRLSSRTERDVTANFPELAGLTALAPDVLLDGEVVLLERGIPSFAALADRMHSAVDPRVAAARPVTFMVFDVLRLYGVSLVDRPLAERRATLERMELAAVPQLSLSPGYTDGAGAARRDPAARHGGRGGQAPGQPVPARPAQPGLGEDHPPAHPGLPGRRLASGAGQRRPDRGAAARAARRRRAALRRARSAPG